MRESTNVMYSLINQGACSLPFRFRGTGASACGGMKNGETPAVGVGTNYHPAQGHQPCF